MYLSTNSFVMVLLGMASLASRHRVVVAFSTAPKHVVRSPAISRVTSVSSLPGFQRYPATAMTAPVPRRQQVVAFSAVTDLTEDQKTELEAKIKAKGDEIRALKESGAEKAAVAPLVEELLALKAQLDPSLVPDKKKKKQQQQPKKQQQQQQKQQQQGRNNEDSNFITTRAEDYAKWYTDIIREAQLAESSPVRGCMVIKPWGMSLWDTVRNELDRRIKDCGVDNAYFPLLIPKSFLSKEAEHVDGFAKECAVVTHHRLCTSPDGTELIADPEAELEDPLIVRPTSETMIWFMFKKWIESYR